MLDVLGSLWGVEEECRLKLKLKLKPGVMESLSVIC